MTQYLAPQAIDGLRAECQTIDQYPQEIAMRHTRNTLQLAHFVCRRSSVSERTGPSQQPVMDLRDQSFSTEKTSGRVRRRCFFVCHHHAHPSSSTHCSSSTNQLCTVKGCMQREALQHRLSSTTVLQCCHMDAVMAASLRIVSPLTNPTAAATDTHPAVLVTCRGLLLAYQSYQRTVLLSSSCP